MQQAGASGVFTFVLVSSTPAPPADQSNVFVLKVLDASGQPVTGATITVDPTMPTMSHGTSAVTVTPNPDGTYTLEPLYFFMGGLWQTAIHAVAPTPAGAEPDAGSVEDLDELLLPASRGELRVKPDGSAGDLPATSSVVRRPADQPRMVRACSLRRVRHHGQRRHVGRRHRAP